MNRCPPIAQLLGEPAVKSGSPERHAVGVQVADANSVWWPWLETGKTRFPVLINSIFLSATDVRSGTSIISDLFAIFRQDRDVLK